MVIPSGSMSFSARFQILMCLSLLPVTHLPTEGVGHRQRKNLQSFVNWQRRHTRQSIFGAACWVQATHACTAPIRPATSCTAPLRTTPYLYCAPSAGKATHVTPRRWPSPPSKFSASFGSIRSYTLSAPSSAPTTIHLHSFPKGPLSSKLCARQKRVGVQSVFLAGIITCPLQIHPGRVRRAG